MRKEEGFKLLCEQCPDITVKLNNVEMINVNSGVKS